MRIAQKTKLYSIFFIFSKSYLSSVIDAISINNLLPLVGASEITLIREKY